MFNILKLQPTIQTIPGAPHISIGPGNTSVVLKNVNFNYENGAQILKDLNFEVKSGQKVALVGGSGSGKSTIVRLLYRFYDPASGSVEIAGQNIRNLDLDSVRRKIAVVPQDTVLFHNDIKYNIHYANFERPIEGKFYHHQLKMV